MEFLVNWLANTPGFAVPFALAALGLIVTEKSGVLSLGAEGFMLMGAMSGVGAIATMGGHPFLALLVAALATAIGFVASIYTPWAVAWGSALVSIFLIGWFWPKGTPEDEI